LDASLARQKQSLGKRGLVHEVQNINGIAVFGLVAASFGVSMTTWISRPVLCWLPLSPRLRSGGEAFRYHFISGCFCCLPADARTGIAYLLPQFANLLPRRPYWVARYPAYPFARIAALLWGYEKPHSNAATHPDQKFHHNFPPWHDAVTCTQLGCLLTQNFTDLFR
jgi:hypothetical protein